MRRGRTTVQKQALYRRIADLAHERAGTEPRDMFIVLYENESVDWSLGNRIARYVAADPQPDSA